MSEMIERPPRTIMEVYKIVDPQIKEVIGLELQNGAYVELYKPVASLQSKLVQHNFQF